MYLLRRACGAAEVRNRLAVGTVLVKEGFRCLDNRKVFRRLILYRKISRGSIAKKIFYAYTYRKLETGRTWR